MGRCAEPVPEKLVKVRLVFVSDGTNDFVHTQICCAQKFFRNEQTLFLYERLEISAERCMDLSGQIDGIVTDLFGKFPQGCPRVVLLDVCGHLLCEQGGIGQKSRVIDKSFSIICEVGKEKRNQLRGNSVVIGGMVYDGVDEIVHQVQYGETVRCFEKKVFRVSVGIEVSGQESAHDRVVFHIVKDVLQKGVRKNKVDADVRIACSQNAVAYVFVEKENIAALKSDLVLSDRVCDAARTYVHDLHIIVAVFGKVDKPRVQAQIDLFVACKKLFAVYDKLLGRSVIVHADLFLVVQNLLFFRREPADFLKDLSVHAFIIQGKEEKVNIRHFFYKIMSLIDFFFSVIIGIRRMGMKKFLAIDIGASSGRHIVGTLENGRIVAEEVYRFPNGNKEENGHLVWDIQNLFSQVKLGIAEAIRRFGKIDSLSVDTWAVDYVLMKGEEEILPCYAYRDGRTADVIPAVHAVVPFEELYSRTGIQFQSFNTIYQLYADKLSGRLESATDYLMLPEYLLYKLTGVKASEYTNATSTGLVNAQTHAFDETLLSRLGLPRTMFRALSQPGTVLGKLKEEIAEEVGGNMQAVLCATHDTASAVLSAPVGAGFDTPYLSSGTWSLLGIEQSAAHTDEESRANNFSNEGGLDFTFRYQKNIMGLWMLQSVRKELGLNFAEAEKLARANVCKQIVDCNDESFLAPHSMCEAVRKSAGALSDGQMLYCIYNSLAHCYKKALDEMGKKLDRKFDCLHIIGGGSMDSLLNELTAKIAGVRVIAGPTEATALGNLLVQMVAGGVIRNIAEGREKILCSFPLKQFS